MNDKCEDRDLIEEVAEYIAAASDLDLAQMNVGTLSRIFGKERTTLTRKFKYYSGVQLAHFICQYKMTRAAYLLAHEHGFPIKIIAKKLGFCTCEYFSRVFTAHFGILPCKYREYSRERRFSSQIRRKTAGVIAILSCDG